MGAAANPITSTHEGKEMEVEKEKKLSPENESPDDAPSVAEECALPNFEQLTADEKRAYLDDLFFNDLFGEG